MERYGRAETLFGLPCVLCVYQNEVYLLDNKNKSKQLLDIISRYF